MNVVVDINGRKAIPVRAIPFLTDWTVLCPEVLVASLSLKGMAGEIHGLTAYRLEGDIVVSIKSSWWVDTAAAMNSLTETSNAKNLAYRDWQRATIQELPDSSFVWRDEFEERFHQSFLDDDGATSDHFVNLKPAILGLDFSPLMSAEMHTLVMHGFQSDEYDQTDASPPTATSIDSADDTKPSHNTTTPTLLREPIVMVARPLPNDQQVSNEAPPPIPPDQQVQMPPVGCATTTVKQTETSPPVVDAAANEAVSVKARSVGKKTLKTPTNWRMRIQAEAYEHWIRLLASGCSPTVHSILDYMATWCETNNVRTDTGIFPRAGHIKNTVLGGGHWTPPNISREQARKHVAQVA